MADDDLTPNELALALILELKEINKNLVNLNKFTEEIGHLMHELSKEVSRLVDE